LSHDCRKIEEQLAALVLDELTRAERQETLVEVESCGFCRRQVQEFKAALAGFDEATQLMQPEEGYWKGYEARLRARLTADERTGLRQRLLGAIKPLARPAWAVSCAALALAALLAWAWLSRSSQPQNNPAPQQATATQPAGTADDNEDKGKVGGGSQKEDKTERAAKDQQAGSLKRSRQRQAMQAHRPRRESPEETGGGAVLAASVIPSSTLGAIVSEEMLSHFEKSQILLRSFRNITAAGKGSAAAISEERRRSRALLFRNILLRREAETTGNLPIEQVLNDLEPVLLDIANLPEQTTAEDVRIISQRIGRKGIISTLQAYSARPAIAAAIRIEEQ
jgi:hypothetical protein